MIRALMLVLLFSSTCLAQQFPLMTSTQSQRHAYVWTEIKDGNTVVDDCIDSCGPINGGNESGTFDCEVICGALSPNLDAWAFAESRMAVSNVTEPVPWFPFSHGIAAAMNSWDVEIGAPPASNLSAEGEAGGKAWIKTIYALPPGGTPKFVNGYLALFADSFSDFPPLNVTSVTAYCKFGSSFAKAVFDPANQKWNFVAGQIVKDGVVLETHLNWTTGDGWDGLDWSSNACQERLNAPLTSFETITYVVAQKDEPAGNFHLNLYGKDNTDGHYESEQTNVYSYSFVWKVYDQ